MHLKKNQTALDRENTMLVGKPKKAFCLCAVEMAWSATAVKWVLKGFNDCRSLQT
uniref:Uncharacterized protein n=1 Tax=Anguilla anguilla TaxID=7936 RepID=A0A0E9SNV3_ANGAN